MISEAQRLQDKYRTIYISTDNVISKYITNRGLHEGLEPLYEQYPDARKKNINPLVKNFFGSPFNGITIGTWSGVFKGIAKYSDKFTNWLNAGNANNKVYQGVINGEPVYTGITKQELSTRLY